MRRINFDLNDETHREFRVTLAERGESAADVLRSAIDKYLEEGNEMIREAKGAATLALPAGVPDGWEIVHPKLVSHPNDGELGALLRNISTGTYRLYLGGAYRSISPYEVQKFLATRS